MFFQSNGANVRRWIVWGLACLTLCGAASARAWISYQASRPIPVDLEVPERYGGGTLMICGGGRMPPEVLDTFVAIAGGSRARLVVVPAYEASPLDIAELRTWWKERGIGDVTVLQAETRASAEQSDFSKPLESATAVWLTGGDQAVLSAKYAGTEVERRIRAVVDRGGVVGGSSAGAAIMTKRMIEQGQDKPVESAGFDLLPAAIVDQHFLRRNRLQRMHSLLEKYPGITGFGIDEGTSLVVHVKRERVIVLGDSFVCAVTPAHDDKGSRFVVLKRGDECTMTGLREGNELINSRIGLDETLAWE